MKTSDEKLGKALRAACARDLPGEEFEDRVLLAVEEGGGEREIGAAAPRRIGLWAAVVAATVLVVVAVRLFAPGIGTEDLAAAPRVDLPRAETAEPSPRPVVITVTSEGEVWFGGEARDYGELKKLLAGGSSDRTVILRADRRARWQVVQWTMQTAADPSVGLWRIHWACGGGKALPVPLPRDRGLAGAGITSRKVIMLDLKKRAVALIGADGDPLHSWKDLDPSTVFRGADTEIVAGPDTPFEEVVRVVDSVRQKGADRILFRGTTPAPTRVTIGFGEEEIVEDPIIEDRKPDRDPADRPVDGK